MRRIPPPPGRRFIVYTEQWRTELSEMKDRGHLDELKCVATAALFVEQNGKKGLHRLDSVNGEIRSPILGGFSDVLAEICCPHSVNVDAGEPCYRGIFAESGDNKLVGFLFLGNKNDLSGLRGNDWYPPAVEHAVSQWKVEVRRIADDG